MMASFIKPNFDSPADPKTTLFFCEILRALLTENNTFIQIETQIKLEENDHGKPKTSHSSC